MAQAHVEDRLGLALGQGERAHQLGLGLVLLADDADHLVQVEIGDPVGGEHLDALLDLRQPVARAPDQHDHAVLEEGAQHLGEAHHPRHALGVEHVQVQRQPHLQLGLAEQLLHQQLGRYGACARHQDHAHLLGGLVADIGQQRQFLDGEQLGDPFDQATTWAPDRGSR